LEEYKGNVLLHSTTVLLLLLKYLSIVVQLLGGYNNIAFLHDLISRPGFATQLYHTEYSRNTLHHEVCVNKYWVDQEVK
jgi:hypothetical protein